MPGLTWPPNISSGTRGPSASCTLSGVYSSAGVFTWSSYPPQSSQVSMNTVSSQPPAWTTASTDCQIGPCPRSRSRGDARRRGCCARGARAPGASGLGVGDELRRRHHVGRALQLGVEGDGIVVGRGVRAPGDAVRLRESRAARACPTPARLGSEGFLSVGDWPPTISRWFGRGVRAEPGAVVLEERAGGARYR